MRVLTIVSLLIATPAFGICTGDCNNDAQVTVDELTRGINITLGDESVDTCPPFDPENLGGVTVVQLVQAIDNALNGCREQVEQSLTGFRVIEFGAIAELRQGLPPPSTGGPDVSTIDAAEVPAGITATVPIGATFPITTLFLAVDDARGFYELKLDEPTTEVMVEVTFSDAPPRDNFDCLFSGADGEGRVGSVFVTTITIAGE